MINIQPLTINDSTNCLEILTATFTTPWKELETIFNTSSNIAWGAFIDDRIIGFIVLSQVLDECEILMCAVNPTHQRQGIARALLTHTLNTLKKVNSIFLEVDITNFPAQKLYESIGFNIVGTRKNYYLSPNGSYSDAIIMRLSLIIQ